MGEGWGGVRWQTSPSQGEARSGGRCRAAKWRAFVPASRSALPVVYAESDSLMNCGKTPSPVGEGWGGGSKHPVARHGPFTYTMSAQVYVNHQTAPSPCGGGLGFVGIPLPRRAKPAVGEGADRRNGVHSFPPLVRRFPLFAQKAIANAQRKAPLPRGGGLGRGQRTLAARHGPFTYTMSAQVYVNLTLSLAGRASVRSGKGVSDRIDESKFRFLNGLLPPPQPSPTGEGAERRNGAHLSPPLVRRFPLFAQKATA